MSIDSTTINHLEQHILTTLKANKLELDQWLEFWSIVARKYAAGIRPHIYYPETSGLPAYDRCCKLLLIQLPLKPETELLELPDNYIRTPDTHSWRVLLDPGNWSVVDKAHIRLQLVPSFSGIKIPGLLTCEEEEKMGSLYVHTPEHVVLEYRLMLRK